MPVELIAEAAQGYEGNAAVARLLARGAARAGADAVKFQLVYADELATPQYEYYELFQALEMPREAWCAVAGETKAAGMRFYVDVYGERSLREAVALGADGVKIHASDFFNGPLVRSALEQLPRVFISLGGISVEELEEFLAAHRVAPTPQVCLLYGFQADPTPIEATNLRRLRALKRRFPGYRFGFMDHADGASDEAMTVALLALAFDVDCIEKHISLDRALALEDYVSALAPAQFKRFAERVRCLEQALGTEDLELTPVERAYRQKALKVVVASRPLGRGDVLCQEDLCLKRTPSASPSVSLYRLEHAVGRTLAVDVRAHQPITKEALR